MQDDSIKNENKSENEKNIWYYLGIFGAILLILVVYILAETHTSDRLFWIALAIFIVAFMFIAPLIEIIKKKRKDEFLNTVDIFRLFFSGIITMLSLYTLYKMMNLTIEEWDKNHILYELNIIYVIFLVIIVTIKNFVNSLKDIPELERTPFKYLGKTVVFILSFTFMFLIPFYGIYEEKENIVLNDMEIPSSLDVYVVKEPLSKTNWDSYKSKVTTIEDEKIIYSLMNNIEENTVTNIRLFERVGYDLIEKESIPYYEINPLYESTNGHSYFETLQEGYISEMKIYQNKYVVAEIRNSDFKVLKKIHYKKYKIPVSESVINQIIKVAEQELKGSGCCE